MKTFELLIATGLWLPVLVAGAVAQDTGDACTEAVRLVASGEATDTHKGWALAHIVGCAEGPTAIAARWHKGDDRPEALVQLRSWNYQIRDQRIAEAALTTASDRSRSTTMRLLGLQTLVGYFDPNASVQWENLKNPLQRSPGLATLTHVGARTGAQAPAQNLPERISIATRELAADANPEVARAAKWLWQAFTDARPDIASLPPGALSLEHVCGLTFRIANRSELDLSVELLTAPGRPKIQIRMPAGATKDRVLDVLDTARLLFGGRELASAAARALECR